MENQPLLLTVPEVASSLRIGRTKVYEILGQPNGLPIVRIGRAVRVPARAVREYAEKLEVEQAPDAAR